MFRDLSVGLERGSNMSAGEIASHDISEAFTAIIFFYFRVANTFLNFKAKIKGFKLCFLLHNFTCKRRKHFTFNKYIYWGGEQGG